MYSFKLLWPSFLTGSFYVLYFGFQVYLLAVILTVEVFHFFYKESDNILHSTLTKLLQGLMLF